MHHGNSGTDIDGSRIATDGNASGQALLHGFVNVGSPRALLKINGSIHPLGQDETAAGITVVQISPPTVTLRSGGRTWTESTLSGS